MTLLKDKSVLSSMERACTECGKEFVIPRMDLWTYKLSIKGGKTAWFCRYNCWRAGQKKQVDGRTGRKNELKSKKPSKKVLESSLRAGLPIAVIAKKHESSSQSVHNWIKSYGLAGIQGQKKPADKVVAPIREKPILEEIVQELPPDEIEQVHADVEIQESPEDELVQAEEILLEVEPEEETDEDLTYTYEDVTEPNPEPAIDELLKDAEDRLTALRKRYVEQADKDFRDQLIQLVLTVTNGKGI